MAYGIKKYVESCGVELIAGSTESNEFTAKVSKVQGPLRVANMKEFVATYCLHLIGDTAEYMLPTPYLCSGMLQTVYCTAVALKRDVYSEVSYDRQCFTMSDQGTVSVDWYPKRPQDAANKAPIVLIIPGLAGSSYEYHIRSMVKHLADSDSSYCVGVVNHRGCSRTPLTSSKPYSASDTNDLGEIVDAVAAVCPGTPLVGLGYSLGANILTKYLGEKGADSLLAAAVAISCPFDLNVAGRSLDASNFLNDNMYQPNLVATMKRMISRNIDILQSGGVKYDVDAIMNSTRMSEIDYHFTCKRYGYSDCWSYYRDASSTAYVDSIRTPFLAINSLDDPITPSQGIPIDKITNNPFTALALTKYGGHLGFFTGLSAQIWYLHPVKQFFDSITSPMMPTPTTAKPVAS
ncbi:hypothetical protein GGI07_002829 [Coemansia sp. Benny D115]|nr:hypothetical protein GGI07_002829 [Coemansia sp. Benny D115]